MSIGARADVGGRDRRICQYSQLLSLALGIVDVFLVIINALNRSCVGSILSLSSLSKECGKGPNVCLGSKECSK